MSHIIVGTRVVVSSASRSAIKGATGVVLQVNAKGFSSADAEFVIKADSGRVGYVRGKFLTTEAPVNFEGQYVSVNKNIVSADGQQKCEGLLALCTLVEGNIANIVFQGDYASVNVNLLDPLGKTRPYNFGSV
ncbi:putative transcription regulatory protein [Erwinia phage Virsaitis27]|nr:putative transcription regulatory protein [Erwinia phage Virsaitis27]